MTLAESISRGGGRMRGFALGAAIDGSAYNNAAAISVQLGPGANPPVNVPVGSSVRMEQPYGTSNGMWLSPGTVTNDATVLAPSVPGTTSGYVAVGPGSATITGSATDDRNPPWTGTVQVTVAPAPPTPPPPSGPPAADEGLSKGAVGAIAAAGGAVVTTVLFLIFGGGR